MKFNKVNKIFVILLLVASLFAEIEASRPARYEGNPIVTTGLPPSKVVIPAGKTIGVSDAPGKKASHGKRRRSGTICRKRGCKRIRVTGKVSPKGKSRAIVCRGNVCRRAVVRKPGIKRVGSRPFGPRRGQRRGFSGRVYDTGHYTPRINSRG